MYTSSAVAGPAENAWATLATLDRTGMVWMQYSEATLAWQESANVVISESHPGKPFLAEDGILGTKTCEAAAQLGVPQPGQCDPAKRPRAPSAASIPAAPEEMAVTGTGGRNWIMIGAGVGAVAIGAAILLRKG